MTDDYTPTTEEVCEFWASRQTYEHDWTIDTARSIFDRWLAAHDAAKRAEWEAEQGETEWEYGNEQLLHSRVEVFAASSEAVARAQAWLYPIRRRRKAGPWEPVTNTESEGKA